MARIDPDKFIKAIIQARYGLFAEDKMALTRLLQTYYALFKSLKVLSK